MLRSRSARIKILVHSGCLSTVMTFVQTYWNRSVSWTNRYATNIWKIRSAIGKF